MKIFSVKRMLGLAAIAGVAIYVRKHGGIKNTFDQLLRAIDDALKPGSSKRAPDSRYKGEAERTGYSDDYSRH